MGELEEYTHKGFALLCCRVHCAQCQRYLYNASFLLASRSMANNVIPIREGLLWLFHNCNNDKNALSFPELN